MNHQGRIDGILAAMAGAELDILFAFSPAAHHVDFGDGVALISGLKPLGPAFAALKAGGASALVVSPAWDGLRAEAGTRTDEVTATDDLAATFASMFANDLPASGRIGIADLGKMAHGTAAAITSVTGAECVDFSGQLFTLAARKTDEEIENARQATIIGEQTYQYMLEVAEPGMPECQLAADMKSHSRALGADDNFMMFHAEAHPLAVQPSGERRLEKGDLILAEITPSYRGQFSQVCRTACLGAPTDEQSDKYALVARAMNNGIAAARPGVPMKAICLGIDEVLRDAGYGEYCEPPYMNRRGHGLGVTSTAPGNVALRNETILEDGMFFVVHPNQYIPETGYFLCGEPILVQEPSAEILTTSRAVLGSIDI
ncbi:MAG: aminopeptidase P family protein [Rhodospirillaceae bacterium]|nr:aminopeptidase P family protein [Rhodospirillaceae bacterium]MBT6291285.1 aminopeptidase P family protein [Rhodospirillaceae bacterium]